MNIINIYILLTARDDLTIPILSLSISSSLVLDFLLLLGTSNLNTGLTVFVSVFTCKGRDEIT